MILDIMAYTIVAIAFGITIYKGLEMFNLVGKTKSQTSSSACSTCSTGACGSCSISNLAKDQKTFHPVKVLHDEISID